MYNGGSKQVFYMLDSGTGFPGVTGGPLATDWTLRLGKGILKVENKGRPVCNFIHSQNLSQNVA